MKLPSQTAITDKINMCRSRVAQLSPRHYTAAVLLDVLSNSSEFLTQTLSSVKYLFQTGSEGCTLRHRLATTRQLQKPGRRVSVDRGGTGEEAGKESFIT